MNTLGYQFRVCPVAVLRRTRLSSGCSVDSFSLREVVGTRTFSVPGFLCVFHFETGLAKLPRLVVNIGLERELLPQPPKQLAFQPCDPRPS